MFRGYSYRLTETEFVKIEKNFLFIVVELVDRKNYRLARTAKDIRNVVIGGGKPRFRVAEENYNVCRLYCYRGLLFDMRPHFVLRFYLDSARVYKRERFAAPFRVGIKPVARYAGRIFHDRKSLPRNLVEKRRFTYVRSSDYCDKRFIGICHNATSFFA